MTVLGKGFVRPMIILELQPAAGEPEFGDERFVGDWMSELPKILADQQNPPWCSYAARAAGRLVGYGGFKGEPDDAGNVEIGYLTFLPERERGVAKHVCAKLVMIAAKGGASAVLAHTLNEVSSSTAVLLENDFELIGEISDPDDGVVWRWIKRLDDKSNIAI